MKCLCECCMMSSLNWNIVNVIVDGKCLCKCYMTSSLNWNLVNVIVRWIVYVNVTWRIAWIEI
jgi:hypothetical protein